MSDYRIPFNKPYFIGTEIDFILDAIKRNSISGNGFYTQQSHNFFAKKFAFENSLLTSSCTDALEMSSLAIDIQPGDEVILPSFTFVSTANAFALRGAKLVFAECRSDFPNLDESKLEALITNRTKAIVLVHYAGVACNMDTILNIAKKYNLIVVEDAAHAITSKYNGKFLGGLGDFGTLSFHETKNITSGEGGLLIVNNPNFISKTEIIWEKGTNRKDFSLGKVAKYEWLSLGSSFLPSELNAAFLFAQLNKLDEIQQKRKQSWNYYYDGLSLLEKKGNIELPHIPEYAEHNAHLFFILCKSLKERNELLKFLNKRGIQAITHYLPLHESPFYTEKHDGRILPNTQKFCDQILRLPMYYELKEEEQQYIIESIKIYFNVSASHR